MVDKRMNEIRAYILIILFALAPVLYAIPASAETVQIEFEVSNMDGLTDQYKVRKILSTLDGIAKVILTDDENIVLLTFDDELSSLFDIKTALASQGYPATHIKQL